MPKPLVSVLMPAYNARNLIKDSVQSVLNQTFSDFELLIIDDGSTDDTLDVVKQFKDKRIKVITNPENVGLTRTLNIGLGEAAGKYVARLDSDDIAYPERLEKQVRVMERDSNTGLVASWTEIIDENGNTAGFGNWQFEPEHLYYILHFRNCLTHSSVIFDKELVCKLGGYSQSAIKCEDFELWGRVSKNARVVQLKEVLVKWREHSSSITSTGGQQMAEGAASVCQKNLFQLTGEMYDMAIIKCLIDCRCIRELDRQQVGQLSELLPLIMEAIIAKSPSYCNHKLLEQYIYIEIKKYEHIFNSVGVSWEVPQNWSISLKEKILGMGYYLTRYRNVPVLHRILPKRHF